MRCFIVIAIALAILAASFANPLDLTSNLQKAQQTAQRINSQVGVGNSQSSLADVSNLQGALGAADVARVIAPVAALSQGKQAGTGGAGK